MEIRFTDKQTIIEISFNARKIIHSNINDIREKVENQLANIKTKNAVVFDFSGVEFIDSTTLGFLVTLKDTLNRYGLKFFLTNVVDKVKDVFHYTSFAQYFTFLNNNSEAANFC